MSHFTNKSKVNKLVAIMLISSLGLFGCGDKDEVAPATDNQDAVVDDTSSLDTAPDVGTTVDDTTDVDVVTPDGEGATVDDMLETPPVDAPELETPPIEVPAVDGSTANESTDAASQIEAAETELEAASLPETAGQDLYESKCKMCHDQGLLEAPKFGDKEAWAPRIAKGIDVLHQHSAQGFGKMTPQAVGDISEAQVYAAVDYIVEQSS